MSTFTKLKAYLGLSIDELLVQDAALANELTPELTKRGVPIGDPLEPTGYIKDPIGEIPMVRQLIEEGRLEEVLDLAAITGTARTDVQAYISPEAIDDAVLQTLVSKGMANEATALGTMLERYFVCEDSVPIAQAFNTISAANPNSTMANRMRPFWQVSLAPYAGTFPAGTSLEAVAEVIVRRLEVLYPVPAVMGRLAPVIESQQKGALDALVILEARNPRRFDGRFADLDTKDAPSSSLPTLETHWNALMKMVRAYPGMGLETVFDNVALSTGQRFTEMNARIGAFVTAISYAAGPSWRADALALDLTPSSGEWTRFNMANYKEPLKATIRAYQRMRVIGGNIDVAVQLMAAGYSSATKLAQARLDAIQALPGLSGAKGEQIWNDARRLASDAAMFVAGVSDTIGGAFDPAPTQPAPSVGQTLATLEGFASLFGSQSYCDCAHCASILGPAAYFVDLMHFVKQEIGAVIPENDLASLRMRRPDLWTFPLTCAATTALVPTLTIVNEALENAVAAGAPDFADRAAIEATVYQSTSGLPGATRSFAQPFAAGLAHAAALLDGFALDRAALAAAVGATEARRVVGVSAAVELLITVPRLTLAGQEALYGCDLAPNEGAPIPPVDAELLAPAMGLDRDGLAQVVTSWFVRQGGAAPDIEATRRNAQSVQDDIEHVRDLTVALLDRMHRLVRASRVLGMTVVQLDRLLKVMGDGALSSLEAFTRLRVLASKAGAPISDDDAAVLAGPLDDLGLARWNRGVRGPAEVWPNSGTAFAHPGLVTEVVAGARAAAARMEGVLGLKAPAVLALIRFLAPHLAGPSGATFDPDAADPTQRSFVLSLANLTLLDRHARLARLLGLAIEELTQLMPLAGTPVVAGLADAVAVAEARDAWRASGRTFEQLVIATGGTPSRAGALPAVATIAAAVRTRYAAVRAVPDDVFATTLGVSGADAATIFAANETRFVAVAGTRIVAPGAVIDDTTVTAPAGITVAIDGGVRSLTSADVARALVPHTAIGVLVPALATATGRSDAEVAALAALTGIGLTGIVGKSIADPADGPELEQLIEAVARVDVATNGWTAAGLISLAQSPSSFGPGPWPTIDDAHPERPTFTFAQATALGRAAVRGTASDRQDLFLAAVANFTGAPPAFTADADVALAALLGTSPATIASIRGRVALAPGAIAALDQLAVIVRLADRLGVDGDVLRDLVSDDDAERAVAAAAVEHAAALRGERDAAEAKRLDDVRAALREQKRDALVDYLVRSPGPSIPRTRLALSAHLLMDVDAGGCATTSRVVAATNAVQEYVTRVTLGLEATSTGARITLSDAGTRSWEWRRAYRVWEANRKVFLWPENYLEPSVRDDKTPLFTALEDALGQGDLEEASILAAYATYIQGLEELASLKIAGAYHDVGVGTGAGTDVLHLIGVTPSDPATFYYRSVTNLAASLGTAPKTARWGHWHKLDISAPTRFVSPVVHQGRLSLLWPTIKTRAKQKFLNGEMQFTGYVHTYTLNAASLGASGGWGPPQSLPLPYTKEGPFPVGPGVLFEDFYGGLPRYAPLDYAHDEPSEGYVLTGRNWSRVLVMPAPSLRITMRNLRFVGELDLYAGEVVAGASSASVAVPRPIIRETVASTVPVLYQISATRARASEFAPAVLAEAHADGESLRTYRRDIANAGLLSVFDGQPVRPLMHSPAHAIVMPIHGSVDGVGVVIDAGSPYLLMPLGDDGARYVFCRVGTSVGQSLARTLFDGGIDGLLATSFQLGLCEASSPFALEPGVENKSDAGTLNLRGSFGAYLRELFFHIPLLIATSLAARGRHADARRWFHRVFDPTSTEVVDTTGTPTGDVAHRQLDRVWRYREFRGLGVDGARSNLSDSAAFEAYREDPFNPHAVARCRLTAYQRHVFGRYVDNLLDWGDLLFAQFQRETVEEARALYQHAAQLLGPRPARLGECTLAVPAPRDYQHIEPMLTVAEPPRIGAETEVLAKRSTVPSLPHSNAVPRMANATRLARARIEVPWAPAATSSKPVSFDRRWLAARSGSWGPSKSLGATDAARAPGGDLSGAVGAPARGAIDDTLAASVVNQLGPVFCVPGNKTLLARWDRVEDRLWKLHHCLDLDGVRRDLALFAPELDPMSRVEATALGLTPDELVSEAANEVPPYRFSYLIERAKGFASSLAGFGGALLGALERRDNEALSILRQKQGLALARMTRQQRELDVDMARQGLAALEVQSGSAEYRRDYYDGLLTAGRSDEETAELDLRNKSLESRNYERLGHASASMLSVLPQVSPPWTVTFGGEQLSRSASAVASAQGAIAGTTEAKAAMHGLLAGYERRADGWRHQLQLAKDELASMARQRRAAELRVKAAEQSLVAYDESVQQLEDVLQFERDRVTNLALHTRLAQGLKALYRLAYGHALALARLAERAYRYERGDSAGGLMAGYWDASIGGLLAGERLLSDLQALDRRFLETNHRELEIDQPFALSQLDPAALWNLRQNGVCQFTVPEVAFDVTYPGHWKRRLRAVRLTIPCVTGPYVNVGATLTLISSQVRPTPTGALVDVPLAHGTTIATSSAQADGGVFELSFRDERYLPFEGQGAVSTWRLELPSKVRAFDYGSISDVVVSLAYSAKPDATRRGALEGPASIDTSILYHYRNTDTTRIVSLRDELGASFVRLLRSPVATPVAFELTDDMLAPVFRAGPTNIADARIAVRLAKGLTSVGALALRLDGRASEPFAEEPSLGGLQTADVAAVNPLPLWTGPHTLELVAAGDVGGDPDALDPAKVLDILLVTTIRLA